VGYHPESVAAELLDAADERVEYDTCKLWSLTTRQFQRRCPASTVGKTTRGGLTVGGVLKTGMLGTEEV
jgi:hypothetical protein